MMRVTLVGAIFMVGCQVIPSTSSPRVDVLKDASGNAYHLLQTGSTLIALDGVSASSTDPSFPRSNVTDGVLTTAWAPDNEDTAPTLTFDLSERTTLDAIAVKASLGRISSPDNRRVLIDVQVSTDGGATYDTIATGLNPPETVLTTLDVPDTPADFVRLVFRAEGGDLADLLVCEVELFGTPVVTPTPTPTPTPSYSPSPTPTPSEEPCECKVTGGGWIYSPEADGRGNDKLTFGFVAQVLNKGPQGNIQVQDHQTKDNFHGRVTGIECLPDDTVRFTGDLVGPGDATFTAVVTDNGEPGNTDIFEFTTSTGFSMRAELGDDTFGGGNIQFHRDCE